MTRIAYLDQVPARIIDPTLRLRRQPRPGPGPRAGEAAGDADVAGAAGGGAWGGEVVEEGAEPVEGVRDGQVPALDAGEGIEYFINLNGAVCFEEVLLFEATQITSMFFTALHIHSIDDVQFQVCS